MAKNNKGQFVKGTIPWNKGKQGVQKGYWAGKTRPTGVNSCHWTGGLPKCKDCNKELDYHKGRCRSCFAKSRIGIKRPKEVIAKYLKRRKMSSCETVVLRVINKYNLPYKFVGNGQFFIERKNPDFININGEQKAVEVYINKHKEQFREGGVERWKKERIDIFSKYGWEIIFLEASNLTKQNILNLLGGGHFG